MHKNFDDMHHVIIMKNSSPKKILQPKMKCTFHVEGLSDNCMKKSLQIHIFSVGVAGNGCSGVFLKYHDGVKRSKCNSILWTQSLYIGKHPN